MEKTNAFVIGVLALMVLIIAGAAYAYVTGGVELLYAAIIIATVIVVAILAILYIVFGTYYFVKQKDTVHAESGLTLDDVSEVDREMEKK